MQTLTFEIADEEKAKALKQVAKALGISVKSSTKRTKGKAKEEKPYNPEFVAEILQSEKDIADGKGIRITLDDIWKS